MLVSAVGLLFPHLVPLFQRGEVVRNTPTFHRKLLNILMLQKPKTSHNR